MRHRRFGVAPAIAYWCDACFVNTSVGPRQSCQRRLYRLARTYCRACWKATITSLNGRVSANTNATVYAIAERAADLLAALDPKLPSAIPDPNGSEGWIADLRYSCGERLVPSCISQRTWSWMLRE